MIHEGAEERNLDTIPEVEVTNKCKYAITVKVLTENPQILLPGENCKLTGTEARTVKIEILSHSD